MEDFDGPIATKVIPTSIEEEMKNSYIDYAMSVIISRALPDVRDGLKPVHRRILYAMKGLGMFSNKPYKKSARVVGETMGKYHPHGDIAIYEALVRMAQPFSSRYPLVDGHGNFGSIDGDTAAAMRYTEVRLTKISETILEDIEKNTVDFTNNFDDTLQEPLVLPAKVPNLLINGTGGIAVAMATNIPPHNLREVVGGLIALIDDPEISIDGLMNFIKGPDFPTSGLICGRSGIKEAYQTGRGIIKIRGRAEIVTKAKTKKTNIIITEIPFQVNKATLIEKIADLVNQKKIHGISNLRDESDRHGIRILLELKAGANPEITLNQLYKHTMLESTFGITLLALVDNKPKTMNLKEILNEFLKHRVIIVRRRTQYELEKAEARAHILEGLLIALQDIDRVIKIIKSSDNPSEAEQKLTERFALTQSQAQAILNMRLQTLTSLESDKLKQEHEELKKKIAEYRKILESEKRIKNIIKKELQEVADKYGDERKTEIVDQVGKINTKDLIANEPAVVMVSFDGYIKRMSLTFYRSQSRGGVGKVSSRQKESDFIRHLFIANTHDYMLFFTNEGKVYCLKIYEIPELTRYSKGKPIVNLIKIQPEEKINAIISTTGFDEDHYLFMVTRKGMVKKTVLSEYKLLEKVGIALRGTRAMKFRKDDQLVAVKLTDGNRDVILASKNGKAVRLNETQIRAYGRNCFGVQGMSLRSGDEVVGVETVNFSGTLLTATRHGFGKRSKIDDYPIRQRRAQGVINIKTTDRNGPVVGICMVKEDDQCLLVTSQGLVIRIRVKEIPVISRATKGVRLIRLHENDTLVTLKRIETGAG